MSPADEESGNGESYSFTYRSGETNQPTVAIIEAVSWVNGVDASALDPLVETIDPDALNDLFGRRAGRQVIAQSASQPTAIGLEVVFEYGGCLVTVDADLITIRPE